jgi:hypothetical protein
MFDFDPLLPDKNFMGNDSFSIIKPPIMETLNQVSNSPLCLFFAINSGHSPT